MKKILIINGHPNSDSYNFGLFEAYKKGALTSGADIKEIVIPKLFIHSEGDQTIPLEEGQMVFDNASMPKTFLKYEGDHLEAMLKIKQEVIKNMDALLMK